MKLEESTLRFNSPVIYGTRTSEKTDLTSKYLSLKNQEGV